MTKDELARKEQTIVRVCAKDHPTVTYYVRRAAPPAIGCLESHAMPRNSALVRVLSLKSALESSRWTLPQLADRFSVTTRTVRRDIAALEEAGVPICYDATHRAKAFHEHENGVQWWALS